MFVRANIYTVGFQQRSSTEGVTVQVFGRHFWKNVERHFLKKLSPNKLDKNVATGTVLHDSIIYLNHLKLIKNYYNKKLW